MKKSVFIIGMLVVMMLSACGKKSTMHDEVATLFQGVEKTFQELAGSLERADKPEAVTAAFDRATRSIKEFTNEALKLEKKYDKKLDELDSDTDPAMLKVEQDLESAMERLGEAMMQVVFKFGDDPAITKAIEEFQVAAGAMSEAFD